MVRVDLAALGGLRRLVAGDAAVIGDDRRLGETHDVLARSLFRLGCAGAVSAAQCTRDSARRRDGDEQGSENRERAERAPRPESHMYVSPLFRVESRPYGRLTLPQARRIVVVK